MLILGLDPSLSCTGWGIVRSEGARLSHVAHGEVATDPKAPMTARLHHLHDAIARATRSLLQTVYVLRDERVQPTGAFQVHERTVSCIRLR